MALLLEISSAALVKSQVQEQKAPTSSVKCSQFLMARCTLNQNLYTFQVQVHEYQAKFYRKFSKILILC